MSNNTHLLVKRLLPFEAWIPSLRTVFWHDARAGLALFTILLPQAIAYSLVAGLPAQVGLLASSLPLIIAALWCSSKFSSVAPTALLAVMTVAVTTGLSLQSAEERYTIIVLITFLAGIAQLLFASLRLGKLIQLISSPVSLGFFMAVALLIVIAQLNAFFPVSIELDQKHQFITLLARLQMIGDVPPLVPTFGAGALALFIFGKHIHHRVPWALFVLVVSTLISKLGYYPGSIVGRIPAQLPDLSVPTFDLELLKGVLFASVLLACISYIETVSVAKQFGAKAKTLLNTTQELVSLGLANMASALFGGMAVSGSFTRSQKLYFSEVKTPLSNIVAGLCMIIFLLWLTPLIYYLPTVILAAMMIYGVINLISPSQIKKLLVDYQYDGYIALVTLASTLVFAPHLDYGIAIGIALSICVQLYHVAKPFERVYYFGNKKQCKHHNLQIPDFPTNSLVIGVEIVQDITFANADAVYEQILNAVATHKKIQYVIIMGRGLHFVDATGVETILKVREHLNSQGVELLMTRIEGPLREFFNKIKFDEAVGEIFFERVTHALTYIHERDIELKAVMKGMRQAKPAASQYISA